MSKKIARLLKADIQESSDLKSIAAMLAGKGRGGDTMLAHITPKEVSLLKEAGGAGTVNPETGLLEFFDITDYGSGYGADYDKSISGYIQPRQQGELYESNYFDIDARQSPFYGEYGGYLTPQSPQQLTPSGIDPTEYYAGQQYAGSAFAYPPATEGMDPDSYRFKAAAEFPAGMASRPDLIDAQRAAAAASALPQGMMDFPVDVGAAARPAIPMPKQVASPLGEAPESALKKYVTDPYKALKEATGLTGTDLLRAGGAGVGALLGRRQSQQAAKQIQQATQEQKNLGAPYQKTGSELQRAAMAGELTPQSAQALQAARAQLAQGVEARGGVGVAQAQAQIEALRQNLLQNQYNLGLQVSQIGDNIALGAIRTGMQLDQQLAAANQQFYTQLAAIAGGGTYGYGAQTPRG